MTILHAMTPTFDNTSSWKSSKDGVRVALCWSERWLAGCLARAHYSYYGTTLDSDVSGVSLFYWCERVLATTSENRNVDTRRILANGNGSGVVGDIGTPARMMLVMRSKNDVGDGG